MNAVSIDRLNELLRLDAETGKLYWLHVTCPRMHNGQEAGGVKYLGDYGRPYWVLKVDMVFLRRGRIVYAMTHGAWPEHQIDHINRNSLDDRPSNLRDVTSKVNNGNRKHRSRNGEAVNHHRHVVSLSCCAPRCTDHIAPAIVH